MWVCLLSRSLHIWKKKKNCQQLSALLFPILLRSLRMYWSFFFLVSLSFSLSLSSFKQQPNKTKNACGIQRKNMWHGINLYFLFFLSFFLFMHHRCITVFVFFFFFFSFNLVKNKFVFFSFIRGENFQWWIFFSTFVPL